MVPRRPWAHIYPSRNSRPANPCGPRSSPIGEVAIHGCLRQSVPDHQLADEGAFRPCRPQLGDLYLAERPLAPEHHTPGPGPRDPIRLALSVTLRTTSGVKLSRARASRARDTVET